MSRVSNRRYARSKNSNGIFLKKKLTVNDYRAAVLRRTKRDIGGSYLEDSVVYGVATTEREDVWKM